MLDPNLLPGGDMELNMSLQHKGTMTIETLRLMLRKFRAEDANDMFHNWAGDPEVCKYLSWGPHKDVETSLRRINNWENNYQFINFYNWAIVLKGKHMAIGSISVEISSESTKTCEIGYCLSVPFWNRGIMTEALRAVMHYLFYEVGYETIRAKYDTMNVGSGKVMEKAGMQFVKMEYHVGIRRDGSSYDCAVYSKQREDVQSKHF